MVVCSGRRPILVCFAEPDADTRAYSGAKTDGAMREVVGTTQKHDVIVDSGLSETNFDALVAVCRAAT